eukprot:7992282-Alexandrium_andersonii.AAC.1
MPMQLERTTAECLWAAFQRACPSEFWVSSLPGVDVLCWCWRVCIADETSSSRRFFAQLQRCFAAMRPGVLTLLLPCLIHILHRGIVPSLAYND